MTKMISRVVLKHPSKRWCHEIEKKIPLGNNRKAKQQTPIKKSTAFKRSSNKRMNCVDAYLRKIMKAQSNKHTTWMRVRSFLPNKWRLLQMMETSKPFVSTDGKSGVELRNYENQSKGGMTTQEEEKKVATTSTTLKPSIQKTIPTIDDGSNISIGEQLEKLCRIRTTEEERKARVKERFESIRIDKEMKERERLEEKRLQEEEKRRQEEELRKEKEALEAASNLVRPLTDDEKLIVKEAVYGGGSDAEILARADNDSVQRKSMRTLQRGCWLNDEVIHYFYLMLSRRDEQTCKGEGKRRSHFFKSFFLTKLFDEGATDQYKYANVKRWSKVSLFF